MSRLLRLRQGRLPIGFGKGYRIKESRPVHDDAATHTVRRRDDMQLASLVHRVGVGGVPAVRVGDAAQWHHRHDGAPVAIALEPCLPVLPVWAEPVGSISQLGTYMVKAGEHRFSGQL